MWTSCGLKWYSEKFIVWELYLKKAYVFKDLTWTQKSYPHLLRVRSDVLHEATLTSLKAGLMSCVFEPA